MTLDDERAELEALAVQTYKDIMATTTNPPEVRLQAAEKALRALGKDAHAKSPSGGGVQIAVFGDHLAKALMGMDQALKLVAPTAPEDPS